MKKLNIVQNWGRWCECHNGALPPMDLNGYQCQKCKQIVCVNCIYKTEKGYLCTECIRKIKPKKIFPISIEYKETTKKYLFLTAIGIILSIILFIIIIILNIKDNLIILLSILPLIVSIIIGITPTLFKKNKNKTEIKEKEIDKLDKKIKNKF
jgi:hypothetical protein